MATRRSVTRGQHSFSQIPSASIPRSTLSRNFGHKTTFNAGMLIPVFVDEVLPGDTINLRMSIYCRIATLLFPIMDNIFLDVHFFFIANRLLWNNWERFNGAQDKPGDQTDFEIPQVSNPSVITGSIYDYMGIPTQVPFTDPTNSFSALPFRGYNLVFNEWYRSQDLTDSVTVPLDDGPDPGNTYGLLSRAKRHDYFTAALPFPQKGPSVPLPLGGSAPVAIDAGQVYPAGISGDGQPTFSMNSNTVNLGNYNADQDARWSNNPGNPGVAASWIDPKLQTDISGATGLADLTNATAATINSLRQAFQIQRIYERDARGGTRYVELLKSHFGVTSPDFRLQRPEYLGGGTVPVLMTPVPSTNQSNQANLAALAAYGTAQSQGVGFVKSFVEHGWVLGIVSARADLNYQQGLERMWSRKSRFDFFWPALQHIGEQGILNKEIYAQGTADDQNVWGYIPRYDEYRYKPSRVSGIFRSNALGTLDAWHLAQDFGELPVLNAAFIKEQPPISRVVAVPTEPQFLFDSFFSYRHTRPMPTYSVPGMIDHF